MDIFFADPLYAVYLIALAISICISFALIGYLWQRRIIAVVPVIGILIAIIFWSSGYIGEQISYDLNTKLFMYNIEYIGIASIPIFFLLFALQYTRLNHLITLRRLILLLIIPVITILLVWTKELHPLMYQNVSMVIEGNFYSVEAQYGIWFWLFLSYSYLIIAVSVIILALGLFRYPHLQLNQVLIIVVIVILPVISGVIYVFRLLPSMAYVDWTGPAFAISAICMTYAITRQRLLDILPVARDLAIEMLRDGYVVLDRDSYILDLNGVMQTIVGIPARKAIGKKLPETISRQISLHPDEAAKNEISLNIQGKQRYYRVHCSPLKKTARKNEGNILLFYDITESKQFEYKLADMATHDYLTGLPNRIILKDRLIVALARAKRNSRKFAVMVCDIDNFKMINDTFGHLIGDRILQLIATQLNNCMRDEDTLSRIGGDEFVVLLPEISGEKEAVGVAKRILKIFQDKFKVDDYEINVLLSIGISIYPDNGEDMDTLLKKADDAMYAVKRQGKAKYCIYGNK